MWQLGNSACQISKCVCKGGKKMQFFFVKTRCDLRFQYGPLLPVLVYPLLVVLHHNHCLLVKKSTTHRL